MAKPARRSAPSCWSGWAPTSGTTRLPPPWPRSKNSKKPPAREPEPSGARTPDRNPDRRTAPDLRRPLMIPMPQFAANLFMLYLELDFLDRFQAAAQDGFKAVEYLFPYALSPVKLRRASRRMACS